MTNQHDAKPSSARWTGWNDPRLRALVFQAVFLLAVLALIGFIVHNTLTNLASRGINTGFGFLANESGFGIIQTLVEYSETSSFGRTFLVGLLNTLLVSLLGIALATLLGFAIGVARLSHNWLVSRLAAVYIEVFRNVPLLLQIFFWYFAVLRALPHPRDSFTLGQVVFLNLRGLYLPKPVLKPASAGCSRRWPWPSLAPCCSPSGRGVGACSAADTLPAAGPASG
jgi:general L-amino acid transport system permease protein